MSRYVVVEDHYIQEFQIQLEAGMEFEDGDLEADEVANLLSRGIIRDADQPIVEEVTDEAMVEDAVAEEAPADDEDAKPRRGR